jgi:pheromone a factor receptor
MWGVLHSGLSPIERMSRNLSEVRVWGPDELTGSVRTVLMVEWSLTVVQSLVFFGLFICRMEVLREGWEFVQSLLRSFRRPASPITLEQGSSARSSFTG